MQLGEKDLSEGEKSQIQVELGIINKRWGTDRGVNVDIEKWHLLTSQEWEDIQFGSTDRLEMLEANGKRRAMGLYGEAKNPENSATTGACQH